MRCQMESHMKTMLLCRRIFGGALAGVGLVAGAEAASATNTESPASGPSPGQVQQTNSSNAIIPSAPKAAENGQGREVRAQAPATFQITEIVKMTESGVESAIIKAYVEQSATVYPPSADEVIYLHQHGVSSDIIAAFIRRGTELQTQRFQSQSSSQTIPTAPTAPASVIIQAPPYVSPAPPVQPVSTYSYPNYVYADYPAYSYYWPSVWFSSWYYPRTWHSYGYPGRIGGFAHSYPSYGVRGGYGGRIGGAAHAPFTYGASRGLSGRSIGVVHGSPNYGARGSLGGRVGPGPSRGRP